MMFRKLLSNKKILFVTLAVILVLIVGSIILVTQNAKETGEKNFGTKTEQDEKDENSNKGDKEEAGLGLEVLEPDKVLPENSSNASGTWGDASDSNTQTGNSDMNDTTDKAEDKKPNEDKENEVDTPEDDEDILEDNITWGDIY